MVKIPEYWVDVPGSAKYQVSNFGNFRRKLKNNKFKKMTPYLRNNQWLMVKVDFNGKYKEYTVHKIVASVFLDEAPNKGMVLYHKNGIITDNYAGNIDWITRQKLGKRSGGTHSSCIPIIKLDPKNGEMVDFYKSISAAARDNYIHKNTICLALKGKLKTAAGYKWKVEGTEFEDDDDEVIC